MAEIFKTEPKNVAVDKPSMRWLQVIEAFRDYRRGDKITDQEEIKDALESYAAHVRQI